MSLDVRAREAAAALQASVAGAAQDPPELGTGPVGRRRLALVAAAVLVVAAAVTVAVRAGDEDAAPVVAGPNAEVPRLVPGGPADALTVLGATDLPVEDPYGTDAGVLVFGTDDDRDPFGDGNLGILWTSTGQERVGEGEDVGDAMVRGNPVSAHAADATSPATVQWQEGPFQVTVASRTSTVDELLTVAAATVVTNAGVELAEDPTGLVRVGAARLTVPGAGSILLPLGGDGHAGAWSADGDEVTVVTVAGGDEVRTAVAFASGALHPVTVRGRDGLVDAEGSVVVWEEAEGVIAAVQTSEPGLAALLAAADGLREASEDEWQAVVAAGPGPDEVAEEPTPPAAGLGDDEGDLSWSVGRDGRAVCADVTDRSVTGMGCMLVGPGEAAAASHELSDGRVLVFGAVVDGTVGVVVDSSDRPYDGMVDPEQDVFAVVVDAGGKPSAVRPYGDDGEPLETIPVPPPHPYDREDDVVLPGGRPGS